MAVSDWSTSASSNASVGGVNIAENMDRSDVNNAIRAMMADVASWYASDGTLGVRSIIQGRARVKYNTTTSIAVWVPAQVVMAGHRFMGSYHKGVGKQFATGVNGKTTISFTTGLAHESAIKVSNWYAIFALANSGDATCVLKLMPFFTVKSVAGLVVSLGQNGAGGTPGTAATYTLATNELSGSEVLLIEEATLFSGRVVNCTASDTGSVTLDDVGSLAVGDRILCAPVGWDSYAYLGSFYVDAAGEPKNIADEGHRVGALMDYTVAGVTASGEVTPAAEIVLRSYVSPLATAAVLSVTQTLSTASTGDYAEYFWHDSSSHEIERTFVTKEGTANMGVDRGAVVLPFSEEQSFYYSTAGSLDTAIVSRSMQVRGWYEP